MGGWAGTIAFGWRSAQRSNTGTPRALSRPGTIRVTPHRGFVNTTRQGWTGLRPDGFPTFLGGALALVADHMAFVPGFDCRAMESYPGVVHRIGVIAGGNNGINF